MMVTKMKDYVTFDPDDDDDDDFRHRYRNTMIAQYKRNIYNKTFSFKIKIKVIKLMLSRTELNFGLIFLVYGGSNT